MMIQRTQFKVATDTGTWEAVSGPIMGRVRQVLWAPSEGDTGDDLELTLLPDENDTGDGWTFLTHTNLDAAFFDTGVNIYAAGDRIRAKVTPAGLSVAGRLYVWTDNRGS